MLLSRVFPELWKFGTHERAERRTPLMLWIDGLANAVAIRFSTLRLSGTQTGYAVTAGRTLILTRVLYRATTAASLFSIGYSDTDRGISNAADGANAVNLDSSGAAGVATLVALAAATLYDISVYYEVPAGKFPRIATPAAGGDVHIQVFGHEV